MSDHEDHALHVLQSLGPGVALAEPDTWHLLLENARFFQLFPPPAEGGDALTDRIEGLPAERAAERLTERHNFSFETEVQTGAVALQSPRVASSVRRNDRASATMPIGALLRARR